MIKCELEYKGEVVRWTDTRSCRGILRALIKELRKDKEFDKRFRDNIESRKNKELQEINKELQGNTRKYKK